MDSHITGLDDTDDKIDVEYTELMGHLDLGKGSTYIFITKVTLFI